VEFEERNRQTHIRARELVFALRVLEAMNSGDLTENKENGMRIVWGNEFNWAQFKNRLDVSRAATVGHSFGGASALAATSIKNWFKASVILDGWLFPIEEELYEGLQSPVLFINASKWQWRKNVLRMLKLRELMAEGCHPFSPPNYLYTFRDISHQAFSDFSVAAAGRVGKYLQLQGDIDPELSTTAIVELSAQFLKFVFKDQVNDLATSLQTVADDKRFAHFILEGTDIPLHLPGEDMQSASSSK